MKKDIKIIVSLFITILSILWYFNSDVDYIFKIFKKDTEIKISLIISIISGMVVLHFFFVKVVGFRDREVFKKFRYFITLNFRVIVSKENRYKSRVYAQRAVCPEIEFKYKEIEKIDNDNLFLFRSNEETKENIFYELEKRDYQKYTSLLKKNSTYKVITYKDIHIWTLSFFDDLTYYINDFKKFKSKPFLLNRLFVLDENIQIPKIEEFVKFLKQNLNLSLKDLLDGINKKHGMRKPLNFNGLIDKNIGSTEAKKEYIINVLFEYFALFIQKKLKVNCYALSKDKFEQTSFVKESKKFWEFSGLGVFDNQMTALVYKGPIYGDKNSSENNNEKLIKYNFQFNPSEQIGNLFDNYPFEIDNVETHTGLANTNKEIINNMLGNSELNNIIEFYANLISYLATNNFIRFLRFKCRKDLINQLNIIKQ